MRKPLAVATLLGLGLIGIPAMLRISHLIGNSGTPGVATGTGCGTPSAPNVVGSDLSGEVGATCTSVGTSNTAIVTITFVKPYDTAPHCTVTAGSNNGSAVMVSARIYPVETTTTLSVWCGTGGTCPSSGAYLWEYTCSQ